MKSSKKNTFKATSKDDKKKPSATRSEPPAESQDANVTAPHLLSIIDLLNSATTSTLIQGHYTYANAIKTHSPMTGTWTVRKTAVGLVVKGIFTGELLEDCYRCAEPIVCPASVEVHESFVFNNAMNTKENQTVNKQPISKAGELLLEDCYECIEEDTKLNLTDLLRQIIILEHHQQSCCPIDLCGFGVKYAT
ncbi:MAG: hypothetical protein AAGI66_00335 [Cyanobacteria bacterium P01_H01_bin.74]